MRLFRLLAVAAIACLSISLCARDVLAGGTVLRIGQGASDISTLDPHRATATPDKVLVGLLFNGLVRFPPGSADPAALEPDLATKWERSADGRTWTFVLRQGVKFHGGWGEFTADDAVYSLQRAADPKRSTFSSDFAGIESVEKLDDYTVKVQLKFPDANFLGRISNYHGGNIVSRKAAEELGAKFATAPVGTGPFAFVEHVTQQYVKLEAHQAYFRGRPRIDAIMYRLIPTDSSRDLAFFAGELDLFYGKREQRWVETMRRRDNMIVDIFLPGEARTLQINRSIPPLDNIKVRQAIAAAINVNDLVGFVGKDVGPASCSVVPTGYLGEDCSVGSYAYDPTRAKALLAEAGFADGFALNATVSNVSAQLPIMEIIQAQLSKVGIRLEMSVVDHPTYHSQIRKDVSALVFYGAARFPVADTYLSEFYHSRSAIGAPAAVTNFSHCSVADDEIDRARIESDPQKQLALWKEAQRKILADVCGIPLFDLKQVWGRSRNLDLGYDLKGALNLGPPITEATRLTAK